MSGPARLRKDIEKALSNPNLAGALERFAEAYLVARRKTYEGVDFERLRAEVSRLKARAAQDIGALADRFEEEARRRGAVVYRAATADDACRYIADLAGERGVRTVVKAKSMASEEIGLNTHLEGAGVRVVETDLGEWIIQQAGQRPSHMVMPAIHLTREEVSRIFSENLGEEVPPDIERLVKVARRELRKAFFEAGMGLSGANIAVAETGSIFIVTNEGNARLATTLPPVHVALVGYEKLVSSLADAATILKALPRSATGQQAATYVSVITGSTPTYREGGTGPKELHIVLLDNGRLEMARDPVFKEALQCIRCASCLNVCPVYQLVGGHVYGHIYTGGIGAILTAFLEGMEQGYGPQSLCIGCRRCVEFCPAEVDIPGLILELRKRLVEGRGLPFPQRAVLRGVLRKRRLFHALLRVASKAQKPLSKGGPFITRLPLSLSPLSQTRSLPALAEVPLRDRVRRRPAAEAATRGPLALYAGCLVDFVYPSVGEAVLSVLEAHGYRGLFPDEQTCCGAPAIYLGDVETARELAMQNIEALEASEARYVITACPTCAVTLIEDFPRLFGDDPHWSARARRLAEKVRDFSAFVHGLRTASTSGARAGPGPKAAEDGNGPGRSGPRLRVTYHDACHLKRRLGISREPRELISSLTGVELVEMAEPDRCCGFGGSYSLRFPELSAAMLERKLRSIEVTGADLVAVDCPGCLLQIAGGLDKKGSAVKVEHTAQILAGFLSRSDGPPCGEPLQ
ncbi:MAG TPA: (Fe-S)-binding protein [Clostridiales bacterium]|nr:(Fe-S)-binding protein [Clostridiales bacterium]